MSSEYIDYLSGGKGNQVGETNCLDTGFAHFPATTIMFSIPLRKGDMLDNQSLKRTQTPRLACASATRSRVASTTISTLAARSIFTLALTTTFTLDLCTTLLYQP